MRETIEKNLGLIYKVMLDLHCNLKDEEEKDEYFFNGLLGLYKGVKFFNKELNTKATSYYYKCIRTEIISCFNKRTKIKRDISLNIPITDDEYIELQDTIASDYNLENEVIHKDLIERMLNAINRMPNKRFKQFLIEYYGINQEPLKQREIALKYGVSKQCVQQHIQIGIKKLKKEMENEK